LTLDARMVNKRGKQVKWTAGYHHDEDALRQEFDSDPELDELEGGGGLVEPG